MTKTLLSLAMAYLLLAITSEAAPEWTALFNGQDLKGWKQLTGTAPYRVENGTLVGETVTGSPNSFLATEQAYDDFELEYDVRMEKGLTLNSGVQFRSLLDTGGALPVVRGYQCETDPSERGWSGGIYDEGRRGWLYPVSLNPAALSLFKEGEWNHFRILACGSELRTWVNGVPVAHVVDTLSRGGFIALQVHSIGADTSAAGRKVAWRNLRIRPATATEQLSSSTCFVRNLSPNTLSPDETGQGWRLLWNGRDSQGWRGAKTEHFPESGWQMKDGVLTVLESGGAESKSGGDIITIERYSHFELQLDFQITEGANSGIKYLVQPALNKGEGSAIGLEYQILDDARHPDAKLGRDGNRTVASLYDLITASSDKPKVGPGEWHHALLRVDGNHIEHWLDGRKVVSYERRTPEFRTLVAGSKYAKWPQFGEWENGHILLQDHGNRVNFRSIKLRQMQNQEASK